MTFMHRFGLALAASALGLGLAAAPAAFAMDQMKGSMHKHMKKHTGMMKGDAMKGHSMKSDTMEKTDAPAQ